MLVGRLRLTRVQPKRSMPRSCYSRFDPHPTPAVPGRSSVIFTGLIRKAQIITEAKVFNVSFASPNPSCYAA